MTRQTNPPIDVLLGSSFLFALNSVNDLNHASALQVAALKIKRYILPDIVLAETAYTLRNRIHQKAVLTFLDALTTSRMELEPITKPILQRASQLMSTYADADLGGS